MVMSPAVWLLLVSLSMLTLLRLRLPSLVMETSPDWPLAPTFIILGSHESHTFIPTVALVIMDESLT